MRCLKILFIVSRYYPHGAGSGRSVRNLAEGCAAAGHEPVVISLCPDGRQGLEVRNGVKIHTLPTRNLYRLGTSRPPAWKRLFWHALDLHNPLAARDVKKIIQKERPDIINTNVIAGFSTSLHGMVRRMGIPLIHTLRDYYLMCPQSGMFRNGQSCDKICAPCKPFFTVRRRASYRVDKFLANSAFIKSTHEKHCFLSREQSCSVLMNVNDNDEISQPRGYPAGEIKFGYIGRITPTKGLEVLLEAVRDLPGNWRLKIAGYGESEYIETLKKLNDDPRITFQGYQDADEFYQSIDVLICPSVYAEPLPRVVFEAYRHALPVIAARSGGTPEIVFHEKSGFLYDPYDSNALKGHLATLMNTPELYEGMSRAATLEAANFTRSHGIHKFLENIQAVLNEAA